LKLIHLINTLSAGGAELHLLTLCRYLKRLGIEMVVACLKEEVEGSRQLRPDFEGIGIPVVNLHAERSFDGRCLVRLVRLLRRERPTLVHTHLPRADFVGAIGHLLYPEVPWIVSVHGIHSKSWSGKWTLPLFSLLWRRANGVISISQAVKSWLVEERHIPAEHVFVIHYGIESGAFAQPRADLRKMWGLDGRAVVGSIGRLEPGKGHENLINAMPTVLQHIPQACLLIAGHDPLGYGKRLQATIDELQLARHVCLVRFQSDVPSFLHALDVFAFASRSEGFGQVLIEAMVAGKPAVTSHIPPLTEIVVDGATGLLVEPDNPKAFADAIVWLLQHPEEARQMGERGRKRVCTHFSAEQMATKTLALYRELLSNAH
jgi:glycosyltransferase involved in cell wall biosynthesis